MSIYVPLTDYLGVIERSYVTTYVKDGGSTVRAALAPPSVRAKLRAGLQDVAEKQGFHYVHIDSGNLRVQNLHDVFFAAAAGIGWAGACRRWLRKCLEPVTKIDDSDFTLTGLFRHNDGEAYILRQKVEDAIQEKLFRRVGLAGEFRRAIYQIVWSILTPANPRAHITPFVVDWLKGSLPRMIAVKPAKLYRKIGKSNARSLLISLPRWLRDGGSAVLVVTIDMSAVVGSERALSAGSLRYTRTSAIDAYEVIRQFLDSIDEIEGLAVFVMAEEGFADDPRRGIGIYPALSMRLSEDVWDQNKANPLAPMVRVCL